MRQRSVVIVVFDGVQGLDVFGPADVFYFANYLASQAGQRRPLYTVEIAARRAGPVPTASGPTISADRAVSDAGLRPDVLLVAGGLAVGAATADRALIADLADLAGEQALEAAFAHRCAAGQRMDRQVGVGVVGDVCQQVIEGRVRRPLCREVGAVLLLTAGPLQVHHEVAGGLRGDLAAMVGPQQLQREIDSRRDARRAPDTVVEVDAVSVDVDGRVCVCEQVGECPVGGRTAAFEQACLCQQQRAGAHRSDFAAAPREIGVSPGRYVERVRIDTARRLLEQTDDGLAGIGRRCGFTTVETFHRAFRRLVGVTPTEYRERFATRLTTPSGASSDGDDDLAAGVTGADVTDRVTRPG